MTDLASTRNILWEKSFWVDTRNSDPSGLQIFFFVWISVYVWGVLVHQDNIEIFAEKLVRGKVGRLGLKKIWWWSWRSQMICRFVCFWIHLSQQVTGFRTFFLNPQDDWSRRCNTFAHAVPLASPWTVGGVLFKPDLAVCFEICFQEINSFPNILKDTVLFLEAFFSTLKVGNFRMKPTLKYSGPTFSQNR